VSLIFSFQALIVYTVNSLIREMLSLLLAAAFATLSSFATAHTGAETEHTQGQEPFVGWTKDDLDAKWGTDVHSPIPSHYPF